MKNIVLIFVLCFGCAIAFAGEEKLFYTAPSELPHTSRAMQTAGFWISRHPSADKVVLTAEQIAAFNARIQNDLNLTKDIFAITENFKTESLVGDLDKTAADFTDKGYFTAEGVRNDENFIDRAKRNMNLPGLVLGIAPRYGMVVHYADVRFLPTPEGLYDSAGDFDFDQLQNSTLDVGTPVAVVHQSADKKWYYVFSSLSDGWVEADRIAIGEVKTIRDFARQKDRIVVTAPKTDLYFNAKQTQFDDYARMGTTFPMTAALKDKIKILLPSVDDQGNLKIVPGYADATEVHIGFLPYTARTIYHQAFAMLNQPYGWGGMYGYQDCSAFLDEVFGTVGIALPRDSKNQALVGQALGEYEEETPAGTKLDLLSQAVGATAILPMKGHILLFLGIVDGRPYAIHDVWAYRERKGETDVPRVINRVVVSDLSLGEGSRKGSLLKRLNKVIEIN